MKRIVIVVAILAIVAAIGFHMMALEPVGSSIDQGSVPVSPATESAPQAAGQDKGQSPAPAN